MLYTECICCAAFGGRQESDGHKSHRLSSRKCVDDLSLKRNRVADVSFVNVNVSHENIPNRVTSTASQYSSPDQLPPIESAFPFPFAPFFPRERVPETKCFVTCTSHDGLAIWTHGQVQYTIRMSSERSNHVQCWILPYAYLILRCGG